MPNFRYDSPDEEYKIEAFKILSDENLAPEDDPAEWIYPEDAPEDEKLRQLAEDIAEHDKVLARILVGTVSGEKRTGEIVRMICAWQAVMGGGHKKAKGVVVSEPWLA
jgi:hypothetical protein